jgi:hypothetical protein
MTMTTIRTGRQSMRELIRVGGAALCVLAVTMSCSTEVTNPGPVQDEFLADRAAGAALVNGAGRAIGDALNWISYTGAAVTREIHPAGSTGSFGITPRWQNGELNADDADLNTHWESAQRARWIAEEAVRRLTAAGPPGPNDSQTLAQYNNLLQLAHLYAGFANRLLGENMCAATIDGGAELSYTEFLDRAQASFTAAIGVTGGTAATIANQANAARGGRAAVRVHLNDWTGAIADAATLAPAYGYNMPYFSVGEDAQRNRIFWASGNSRESGSAYRAHTQWNTWHYDYQIATTDPRVPIATTTLLGDAAIECCGRVPFYPEAKHIASASPIRLTSGREMLLIQAEERLRASDIVGGMAFINQTRTAAGVAGGALVAADLNDAWRLLKRERGIELWLEGRRLGDFRRWAAASTPGAVDPLETVGPTVSHLTRQDLCFPISKSERETNPNF